MCVLARERLQRSGGVRRAGALRHPPARSGRSLRVQQGPSCVRGLAARARRGPGRTARAVRATSRPARRPRPAARLRAPGDAADPAQHARRLDASLLIQVSAAASRDRTRGAPRVSAASAGSWSETSLAISGRVISNGKWTTSAQRMASSPPESDVHAHLARRVPGGGPHRDPDVTGWTSSTRIGHPGVEERLDPVGEQPHEHRRRVGVGGLLRRRARTRRAGSRSARSGRPARSDRRPSWCDRRRGRDARACTRRGRRPPAPRRPPRGSPMSGLFDAGQPGWSSSMPGAGRSPEPVSTQDHGVRRSQQPRGHVHRRQPGPRVVVLRIEQVLEGGAAQRPGRVPSPSAGRPAAYPASRSARPRRRVRRGSRIRPRIGSGLDDELAAVAARLQQPERLGHVSRSPRRRARGA